MSTTLEPATKNQEFRFAAVVGNFPTRRRKIMKRKMLLLSLAVLVCFTLFAGPARAQIQDTCAYTFTSGTADSTGGSYMQYCVTASGTLSYFNSPLGVPFGLNGVPEIESSREGYGFCDADTGINYYNWGEENYSNNWNPATLVSQTATAVTIARTTTDGLWTLTQTFTQVANGAPHLEIKMNLKNNSDVSKTVYLVRWANVAAADDTLNNLDNTLNSAWGYVEFLNTPEEVGPGYGLMVQNAGTSSIEYSAFVMKTIEAPDGPSNVCSFNVGGPYTNINGSMGMDYSFRVSKNETETATVNYTFF
jgi:hypothetical protein